MHIYKKLYCDAETGPHKKKIIRKIKYHGGLAKIYVITLADGNDYFDLIPGYALKQKAYPIKELHIMGLASGYDNAVELVQQMLADFTKQYDTYWFKEFLVQEKEMNFTGYHRK
jgi:hypothetical protein